MVRSIIISVLQMIISYYSTEIIRNNTSFRFKYSDHCADPTGIINISYITRTIAHILILTYLLDSKDGLKAGSVELNCLGLPPSFELMKESLYT